MLIDLLPHVFYSSLILDVQQQSMIKKSEEPGMVRQNLFNTAISALTYGLHCLVLDPKTNKLFDCILTIHEQYINILHLIIHRKASYLLKLHQIYNITDNQFTTQSKLKQHDIDHYLILYTQSLDSFTFAFKTQREKEICKIAVMLFVREAKLYYDRLNQFDPFKAEAMMTFLEADKDGGNLLDIAQIQNILKEMKIHKTNQEILKDIAQINKILYDYQKLKKPKDMKNQQLNQLGFQYLLRYYSIKDDLAKIFKQYCSQYRIQARSSKTSIVSLVRYNQNPIMSAAQLRQFYEKMLFMDVNQEYCKQLIQSFPVYDGQGKQKVERQELISFNNFCSLLSSVQNSAFAQQQKQLNQPMTYPLTDYYIFSDFTNYSLKSNTTEMKINHYELGLKRGIRCLQFNLVQDKISNQPFLASNQKMQNLGELLKIIATKAFQFNSYPIILKFQFQGMSKLALDKSAQIIKQVFEDHLFLPPQNYQQTQQLPSPSSLMRKVLIMANMSPKMFKTNNPQQSLNFFRIVSLFQSKVDLQRKGLFAWNCCWTDHAKVHKLQAADDQNFSNYTKRFLVKSGPTTQKGQQINKSSSVNFRMGIQMTGLSFTNINEQNYYIQSLFLQNGGAKCGYLPKPSWMCHNNPKNQYAKNFDIPLFSLGIKVLSGQNCIINQSSHQKIYVEASIRGNKREEEVNQNKMSSFQNPGYYVQFDLECQFSIYCMDLAVLMILVRSQNSKKILSGRAIPIRHLKQGLHPLYLLGDHFKQSVSSYLFLHAEHRSPLKKTSYYHQPKS